MDAKSREARSSGVYIQPVSDSNSRTRHLWQAATGAGPRLQREATGAEEGAQLAWKALAAASPALLATGREDGTRESSPLRAREHRTSEQTWALASPAAGRAAPSGYSRRPVRKSNPSLGTCSKRD